jgi:glycosyltransferase involved in cell wall biosynthesis
LSSGGGVNKVIRDLAVIFSRKLGCEVSVVNGRSEAPPTYSFPAEVQIDNSPEPGLRSYLKLLRRLRKAEPDIVIGSWAQDNILICWAFRGSRTKVVLVEHASWHHHSRAVRLLRRICYRRAARVVAINPTDLAHYQRYLENVRLIPNPVAAPEAAGSGQREKLVLAVGHLQPLKNFEDAIRAMHRSKLEAQGWSLAIVGSGRSEPALRALITELGLKRTHVHPPTGNLRPWYARASLLVLPSKVESFSLVVAEAMLAGVIPIAYASDGPSFLLRDFPDLLVPMGDVSALAARMVECAGTGDDDALRERLAQSVRTRFSPQVVAQQWRELLSELTGADLRNDP